MYRTYDRRLFALFSFLTSMLALGAFALVVVFHFYIPRIFYRDLALGLLAASWLFRMQVIMHKVEIMEVRIMSMTGSPESHARIWPGMKNLMLVFYFLLFWFTLLGIVIGFVSQARWDLYLQP